METFTITAYNASTGTATVTFVVNSRPNFAGGTFTGIKVQGVPKDTKENVRAFLRTYVEGLIAGKQSENLAQAAPSAEVAGLLGQATEF